MLLSVNFMVLESASTTGGCVREAFAPVENAKKRPAVSSAWKCFLRASRTQTTPCIPAAKRATGSSTHVTVSSRTSVLLTAPT